VFKSSKPKLNKNTPGPESYPDEFYQHQGKNSINSIPYLPGA
jgi:hypothetical protein